MAHRKLNALPHEDHVGIGESLYECRCRFQQIATDLGEAYRKDARVNRIVRRALGAVDQLRSELNTWVKDEHTDVASDRKTGGGSSCADTEPGRSEHAIAKTCNRRPCSREGSQ